MRNLEIKTLENISIDDILDCLNKSFSDYKVPMQFTLLQLENKILGENILMPYRG